MAVQNVNEIGRVQQSTTTTTVAERRRRLELYTAETLEKYRGTEFRDLTTFTLPLGDDERQGVTRLFASVSAEDRQRLSAASAELGSALLAPGAIGATGEMSSGLRDASSTALATYLLTGGSEEYSRVNQGFMSMALAGIEYQLGGFAARVQENTMLAKDTRTQAAELRDMLSDWPEGETRSFTWTEVTFDEQGKPTATEHEVTLDRAGAEALLEKLDAQLGSLNDINEMAKFDLQRMHQDYQQGVQTLAAIQKDLHDNLKQVLNNIKS
jgi:hypothetical protein